MNSRRFHVSEDESLTQEYPNHSPSSATRTAAAVVAATRTVTAEGPLVDSAAGVAVVVVAADGDARPAPGT